MGRRAVWAVLVFCVVSAALTEVGFYRIDGWPAVFAGVLIWLLATLAALMRNILVHAEQRRQM